MDIEGRVLGLIRTDSVNKQRIINHKLDLSMRMYSFYTRHLDHLVFSLREVHMGSQFKGDV